MHTRFVIPATGRTVPDPATGRPLPESGAEVAWSDYWTRRHLDGDVLYAQAPAAEDPPSEAEGDAPGASDAKPAKPARPAKQPEA